MHAVAPHKKLIEAPTAGAGADCESCAHCEWMAMNSLEKLLSVLQTGLAAKALSITEITINLLLSGAFCTAI
jgi:quinolinate synthase